VRILLTNDDGINAPGLKALYEVSKEFGDPLIVAPQIERSAAGHAITLSDPLRVQEIEQKGRFYGYAVNGTPADCVKIAVKAILKTRPALVISGINLGSNLGTSVIYSGTVSAATEGVILGIPALAISLDASHNPDFSLARKFISQLLPKLNLANFPVDTALNINIPAIAASELAGIELTRQGKFRFEEYFDRRLDPGQRVYYWLTGKTKTNGDGQGADSQAIAHNRISITPIHYDMTNYAALESFRYLQQSLSL
jgi:5'-nucleotidase